MTVDFTLRPLTAADGAAVAELTAQSRSTTRGLVRAHTAADPKFTAYVLANGAIGVCAEVAGRPGLAGIIWLHTGRCWVEEAVVPYAYLYGKVVHPEVRRLGIGLQLSAWVLDKADELLGRDRLTFGCVSPHNAASLAGVVKWGRQRVDGRVVKHTYNLRRRPPRPLAGVQARPAEEGELEEFLARACDSLHGHNLFPARTVDQLARRLQPEAGGPPLAECLVATDPHGRLLSGLVLHETGRLTPVRLDQTHPLVRAGGALLGLLPPGGIIQPIRASDFWFAPGQAEAALYLWEQARWLWRERGSMLSLTVDRHSPIARLVQPARLRRSVETSLFLAGPVQFDPERPIYAQHV